MDAVDVYRLARAAGMPHERAVIATAISKAESGWNPSAVGDTTLTDATWGPSIGLWQIRSVKADKGTGRIRDASRLKDPAFNAASMAAVSSGGSNWQPWSVYTNGSYRQYVDSVRTAVAKSSPEKGSPIIGSSPVYGGGSINNAGDLGGLAGDLGGFAGGLADGVSDGLGMPGKIVSLLVKEMAPAVLIGVGVVGGFAIIAVGAWRGMEKAA